MERKRFLGNQKSDFTITKVNFPENTSVYCNQGTILTLKAGEYAIYLDHVILGQIIAANISPPNLDKKMELYFMYLCITPKLGMSEVLKSSWHL